MSLPKISKENILVVVQRIGPCQPIDLRREIKEGDTVLFGALLSELVADLKLAITKVKRGGGPLYYDPTDPASLEKAITFLNEKDHRTIAMLQAQKIMREDTQDPLVRVGLQNTPDFSKRFVINENGKEVVYWRYFLVEENNARKIVSGEKEDVKEELQKQPSLPKSAAIPSEDQSNELQKPMVQKSVVDSAQQEKKEKKPRAPRHKKNSSSSMQPSLQDWLAHDTLYEKVQFFSASKKGVVTNPQVMRPNTELLCVMTHDYEFGKLSVFVFALNKKKITEKEITRALLAARGQGLPLLVLSVEDIPLKLSRSFADQLNVYFKKL